MQRTIVTDRGHHDHTVRTQFLDLLHERLIPEIRSADAEVQDMDLPVQGVVESIQEPGCVAEMIPREDTEDVEFRIRGQAWTVWMTSRDHSCDEGPVTDLIILGRFVRPIRDLCDSAEVGMSRMKSGVEDRDSNPSSRVSEFPELGCPQGQGGLIHGGRER